MNHTKFGSCCPSRRRVLLCVRKLKKVTEKVTEAVTRWMIVETRVDKCARWEEWFKKVAERAERKTAREKRAQQME